MLYNDLIVKMQAHWNCYIKTLPDYCMVCISNMNTALFRVGAHSSQIRDVQKNPQNLKYLRVSGKEIITCDRVEVIIVGAIVEGMHQKYFVPTHLKHKLSK